MQISVDQGVTEVVRKFIQEGGGTEGSRLPPERELADRLALTRNQVRSAFKKLEREGLIWRHVGKGTFIGTKPSPRADQELADLTNPREVIEARLVIEPILAKMAARRATPRNIDALESLLNDLEKEADPETFQRLDRRWHALLAEASGNMLLKSFLDIIHGQTDPNIWGRLRGLYMTTDRMAEAVAEHRQVFDAVRMRDMNQAEEIMREHIRSVRRCIFGELD